ncbi:hypothetical protein XENOCAPTIV_030144 [Xenoophorus captivus]|uniref:Uncharacterized protein n=1 Tax=Xenoophorus captivus TaxID=1517983 RepID=A0ABV0QVU9_9TELE
MQLDDLSNQQNGHYQSLSEAISTAQLLYSPPSQTDSQLHQGPYQQSAGQVSHENNIQPTRQLNQGAYQQSTAGQPHPGAFQQPAAQLHQAPCQCQTSPVHAAEHLSSNGAQNPSLLLCPFLPPHQLSLCDSAGHSNSPHRPLNLQPLSAHRLSVPRSPQHHYRRHECKACMSLLFKDKIEGGESVGHLHRRTSRTSTSDAAISFQLLRSSRATLPHALGSPTTPSPDSESSKATSPSYHSTPSSIMFPLSLYEDGELSLLNYCLHHIVSRRTSSPTLPDRGGVNHPIQSHIGETNPTITEHKAKSQSLEAPLPSFDKNLVLSSLRSEGRADHMVC